MNLMRPISREDGFVSLMTSILLGLLLVIVTVSMVTLEIMQLRKAADAERSLRAYYTAESGVEDAIHKVLNGTITSDQTCAGNPAFDAAGNSEWTCQQVSFSGTPEGRLDQTDFAKTVDPGTNAGFGSVLLEWDQSTSVAASYFNPALGGGMPTQAAYNATPFAAPIEMQVVKYPRGVAVTTANVCTSNNSAPVAGCTVRLQNALILPGNAASAQVSYGANGFTNGGPYRGNCAAGRTSNPYYAQTSYRCYMLITNFNPANDYLFRLRTRYATSAYKMTFYTTSNGTGAVLPVNDGTATIDVTARAGNSYRRTVVKLPMNNSASGGLNFVMYSDTDICKNFNVVSEQFPPGGICGGYSIPVVATPPPGGPPVGGCSTSPHDIALVLDISNSMLDRWQTGSKKAKLNSVAREFINSVEIGTFNHMGIVMFADNSRIDERFTSSTATLLAAVNSYSSQHGTMYIPPLTDTRNLFNVPSNGARPAPVEKVIVFVSDGRNDNEPMSSILQRTNQFKAQGVVIYTIAINSGERAFNNLLSGMASPGKFIDAHNEQALEDAMSSIAGNLTCN